MLRKNNKDRKRAQMTHYFFSILLALLIFIPTILWASQLFVGSNQAEESFENLVRYVDAMAGDPSLTSDSIPLYMDENTFIMFINPEIKSVWGWFSITKAIWASMFLLPTIPTNTISMTFKTNTL